MTSTAQVSEDEATTTRAPTRTRRRIPPAIVSALVALLLTFLAFPEVLLLRGSLSSIGLNPAVNPSAAIEEVSVYPNPEDLEAAQGQFDVGSRAWQVEPAAKFMNRVIYEGESFEWNPYSAGGSLGPETLADMKLSPFVVAVALLGGRSAAVTVVTLAFIAAAFYCLQQLFVRSLSFSRASGVAACVVFVLGGWTTARLGSPTAAAYLIFPIILYALVEYQRARGPARLVAAVAAHAALFATTFVPGIVLVLILVHSVALLLDLTWEAERRESPLSWRDRALVVARQAVVPALAFLATAWIWLPNIDALMHAGDEMRVYNNLDLPTKEGVEWLSVLTPRHYLKTYDLSSYQDVGVPVTRFTAYLGIAPVLFTIAALPRSRALPRRLLVLLLVVAALATAMHLGIPVVKLLGHIPVLTPISGTYWASITAGAIALAFGVAVHVAQDSGLSWRAALGAAGALLALFVVVGIGQDVDGAVVVSLALAALAVALAIVVAWLVDRSVRRPTVVALLTIGLVALELLSYQNHVRLKRYDHEDQLPPYVTFLQDNLDGQRIYNGGRGALAPEWGSAFGIRQLETINLMQLPWYRSFFLAHVNPKERQAKFLENGRRGDAIFSADPSALDNLSVKYLVVDTRYDELEPAVAAQYPLAFEDTKSKMRVYENTDAFPRAFVSGGLVPDAERRAGPRWQRDTAFTDDDELLSRAEQEGIATTGSGSIGDAVITSDHHGRVTVEVDAERPGVLVLTDAYHPNWRASVDGTDQHIGRVNDVGRGVVVPAGHSTVVFEYRSDSRRAGIVISSVTVTALIVGCAVWAVRRRRPARRP